MLKIIGRSILAGFAMLFCLSAKGQTDADGVFMAKRSFCNGLIFSHSSWKEYWEGTYQRENLNLGTVSTSSLTLMGTYGITDRLNLIYSVPKVWTKASAGTMHGMNGFQDLGLTLKGKIAEKELGKTNLSLIGALGFSTPITDYVIDFLPLSIGLGSTNISGRAIVDWEMGHWYTTVSAAYVRRSNVFIDRQTYYDTEQHYTNEVRMPNLWTGRLGIGWRDVSKDMIFEATVDRMNTIGGFDIRKNDMPFPSNNMDNWRAGVNVKLPVYPINGLAFVGGSMFTLSGRNMGKATSFMAGLFYVVDLNKKTAAAK